MSRHRLGRSAAVVGLVAVAGVLGTVGGTALAGGNPLAGLTGLIGTAAASPTAATTPAPVPTDSQEPTPSPTPSPRPSPTPEPTPVLVPGPLSALPVTAAQALQHPIAVLIDDHRDARPQAGFNAASIVWQAPAEGGIPRYMLVFGETLPSSVGPIRSAREYFIDWASELDAMFVHVGGAPGALATLRSHGHGELVYNADGFRFEGTQMWRVTDRRAPHNVFSDADHLRAMAGIVGATDGAYEGPFAFGQPTAPEDRREGTTITLRYPYETVTYRYDPGSNSYRRYLDGASEPQVDAADGIAVHPTNVVVLRMRFGPLNDGHPEKKRLEAADVGTGEAIVSTGGRIIHGTWSKAAVDAPTQLFDDAGRPIVLAPGQTFVQVLALSYEWSATEGTIAGPGIRER